MPSRSGPPGHSRHTVLVVDDVAETRDAIVTLLLTKGFDAVGAASGFVALELFTAGMRPCVMLLDVRMPEMDGWELWERMRAHEELARISVVILTAETADHARAEAAGIRELLRKPVDGRALVAVVDRHCDRRHVSDRTVF